MNKDTVACTNIENWWNGRVLIDEIKIYADDRGMVSEVWRIDSIMGKDSKQCYISETAPYVMRGPHEHSSQVDEFVSWKNNMVYQMFNPQTNEMKTFTTTKDKIYRVHVDIGIIHSYRNLDKEKSFTLNFPTSLFMGEGKKFPIDEIRHEENYKNNDVIFIFGAGGKLGKALTSEFFSNMGKHQYDVIPCYEKLKNKEEVESLFNKIDLAIGKDRNVFFINCASLTNVQDVNTQEFIWEWSNVTMPVEFAKSCKNRNWKFIQFSSDYVYQNAESNTINFSLSPYTRSKMRMETSLKNLQFNNISILRVANLFDDDTHNVIYKMKCIVKDNNELTVDSRIKIFPSHVTDVSKAIYKLYSDRSLVVPELNLVPSTSYFLPDFVKTFFSVDPVLKNGKIKPWHDEFESFKPSITFTVDSRRINELVDRL